MQKVTFTTVLVLALVSATFAGAAAKDTESADKHTEEQQDKDGKTKKPVKNKDEENRIVYEREARFCLAGNLSEDCGCFGKTSAYILTETKRHDRSPYKTTIFELNLARAQAQERCK